MNVLEQLSPEVLNLGAHVFRGAYASRLMFAAADTLTHGTYGM